MIKITQKFTLNKVDPPDRTIFWNKTLLRSKSDFCIEYKSTSWSPSHSSPIKSGLNKTSGARKRAGPILNKKIHVAH